MILGGTCALSPSLCSGPSCAYTVRSMAAVVPMTMSTVTIATLNKPHVDISLWGATTNRVQVHACRASYDRLTTLLLSTTLDRSVGSYQRPEYSSGLPSCPDFGTCIWLRDRP